MLLKWLILIFLFGNFLSFPFCMYSLSRVACVRACEWAFISIALQDKRFLPHGKDKALNHTSQQEVCPALLVSDSDKPLWLVSSLPTGGETRVPNSYSSNSEGTLAGCVICKLIFMNFKSSYPSTSSRIDKLFSRINQIGDLLNCSQCRMNRAFLGLDKIPQILMKKKNRCMKFT